jgi:hypothetical protein
VSISTAPRGRPFPPEHIAQPAHAAAARLSAGQGTVEDLIAYRAWITWWRMNGDTEENLLGPIQRAYVWAIKLGTE